jgi:hypothetical protein
MMQGKMLSGQFFDGELGECETDPAQTPKSTQESETKGSLEIEINTYSIINFSPGPKTPGIEKVPADD